MHGSFSAGFLAPSVTKTTIGLEVFQGLRSSFPSLMAAFFLFKRVVGCDVENPFFGSTPGC